MKVLVDNVIVWLHVDRDESGDVTGVRAMAALDGKTVPVVDADGRGGGQVVAKFKKGDLVIMTADDAHIGKGSIGVIDQDDSLTPWCIFGPTASYICENRAELHAVNGSITWVFPSAGEWLCEIKDGVVTAKKVGAPDQENDNGVFSAVQAVTLVKSLNATEWDVSNVPSPEEFMAGNTKDKPRKEPTTQDIQARHDAHGKNSIAGLQARYAHAHKDRGTLLKRLADLAAYARDCEALGLIPQAGVLMSIAEGKS